ncbi:hypothetical protein [Asanoa hainanensis]|uniref:hypothetical protein n=1 Tax=Asanoa hainanensis TaxID=560556 RepID=UPI0015C5E952|nr:hypothetical protein [Asanoa hainanensis]
MDPLPGTSRSGAAFAGAVRLAAPVFAVVAGVAAVISAGAAPFADAAPVAALVVVWAAVVTAVTPAPASAGAAAFVVVARPAAALSAPAGATPFAAPACAESAALSGVGVVPFGAGSPSGLTLIAEPTLPPGRAAVTIGAADVPLPGAGASAAEVSGRASVPAGVDFARPVGFSAASPVGRFEPATDGATSWDTGLLNTSRSTDRIGPATPALAR